MNIVMRILAVISIISAIGQAVSIAHGHLLSRDLQYTWVAIAGTWSLNYLLRTFTRP